MGAKETCITKVIMSSEEAVGSVRAGVRAGNSKGGQKSF